MRSISNRPDSGKTEPPNLYGEVVKLNITKETQDGERILKILQVRIGGVLNPGDYNDFTLFIPIQDAIAISRWAEGDQRPTVENNYVRVVVKVDDMTNVLGVVSQLEAMGLDPDAQMSTVERANALYVLIQIMLALIGLIALIVAAIGIANTMTMAIMERTREIGLMKALGATNVDVLLIFLGEAIGIGLIGGLGGVGFGTFSAYAIENLASQVLTILPQNAPGPGISLSVHIPSWLFLFCILFAALIGLFSGLYPSMRAANLTPIDALKYE
jgi:putative ABC transport system permease protein